MSEMIRDERESLEDELASAKAYADEMRGLAATLAKFSPWHGSAKEVYADTAAVLADMADDFEFAAPFAAMRRRLEDKEQTAHDADVRNQRIDYQRSVL